MKIIAAILLSMAVHFGLVPGANTVAPADVLLMTADVVFKNGNVYTVNERQPRAEAIAVKGDRIVFVGSNRDVKRYEGAATRIVDLHGGTVVPGLTDAHNHLIGVGQREMTLNLEGTQ